MCSSTFLVQEALGSWACHTKMQMAQVGRDGERVREREIAKQSKAKQAQQSKAKQSKASKASKASKQSKAKHSNTKPSKAKQSIA